MGNANQTVALGGYFDGEVCLEGRCSAKPLAISLFYGNTVMRKGLWTVVLGFDD